MFGNLSNYIAAIMWCGVRTSNVTHTWRNYIMFTDIRCYIKHIIFWGKCDNVYMAISGFIIDMEAAN